MVSVMTNIEVLHIRCYFYPERYGGVAEIRHTYCLTCNKALILCYLYSKSLN